MNKLQISKWLSKYEITKYKIHDNLIVDVHEDVWLRSKKLTSLPFQFGIVQGHFSCSSNKLTSLEHCPNVVQGYFYCHSNKLTSLEHCLKIVKGNFDCCGNQLTSLEHCPKVVHGNFYCDDNLKQDMRYLRYSLARQLSEL